MLSFWFLFTFLSVGVHAIENKIVAKVENTVLTSHELKNKIRVTLVLSDQEINQVEPLLTKFGASQEFTELCESVEVKSLLREINWKKL